MLKVLALFFDYSIGEAAFSGIIELELQEVYSDADSCEAIKGFGMLPNKRGSRDVDSHMHCLPVAYVATHTLLAMNELGRNGRKRPRKRPVLPSHSCCM